MIPLTRYPGKRYPWDKDTPDRDILDRDTPRTEIPQAKDTLDKDTPQIITMKTELCLKVSLFQGYLCPSNRKDFKILQVCFRAVCTACVQYGDYQGIIVKGISVQGIFVKGIFVQGILDPLFCVI